MTVEELSVLQIQRFYKFMALKYWGAMAGMSWYLACLGWEAFRAWVPHSGVWLGASSAHTRMGQCWSSSSWSWGTLSGSQGASNSELTQNHFLSCAEERVVWAGHWGHRG
jgi:hypothetical protein